MIMAAPKCEILLTLKQMNKSGFARVTHSDTRPHITVQSARQLLGWDFCVVQEDTFYPRQEYEQVNFYKKSCLYIVGRSV